MGEKKGLMPWNKREILELQCALVLLGYQPNCDGEMGQNTFNELKRFQQKHRLEVSGLFDHPTVAKLLNAELRLFPRDVASVSEVKTFLNDRFGVEEDTNEGGG